jgi:hypothetical protein
LNRPRRQSLSRWGYWGWGLLLVPLLLWLGLRQVIAVGLPERWLAGLAALRWAWLLICAGLILADLIWKQKSYRAAY